MATVCVNNFPNETSEADIRDLFFEYGSIQQVKLFTAEPDLSLPSHGYFDLSSSNVARAIAELNGQLFNGSIICVSHVSHRPLASEVVRDHQSGLIRHTADARPTIRSGVRYEVATVEKAIVPEGGQGEDWHRYVLSCGCSQMTGLHRGTLEEVTEYAASCAELVNSRGATGKTTRPSHTGRIKGQAISVEARLPVRSGG